MNANPIKVSKSNASNNVVAGQSTACLQCFDIDSDEAMHVKLGNTERIKHVKQKEGLYAKGSFSYIFSRLLTHRSKALAHTQDSELFWSLGKSSTRELKDIAFH